MQELDQINPNFLVDEFNWLGKQPPTFINRGNDTQKFMAMIGFIPLNFRKKEAEHKYHQYKWLLETHSTENIRVCFASTYLRTTIQKSKKFDIEDYEDLTLQVDGQFVSCKIKIWTKALSTDPNHEEFDNECENFLQIEKTKIYSDSKKIKRLIKIWIEENASDMFNALYYL